MAGPVSLIFFQLGSAENKIIIIRKNRARGFWVPLFHLFKMYVLGELGYRKPLDFFEIPIYRNTLPRKITFVKIEPLVIIILRNLIKN